MAPRGSTFWRASGNHACCSWATPGGWLGNTAATTLFPTYPALLTSLGVKSVHFPVAGEGPGGLLSALQKAIRRS